MILLSEMENKWIRRGLLEHWPALLRGLLHYVACFLRGLLEHVVCFIT
jgi:hypothetical protein